MRSDFYQILEQLPKETLQFWKRFQQFVDSTIVPTINEHWNQGTFPSHVVDPFGQFLQNEFGEEGYTFPPANALLFRLIKLELGRKDPSMASFFAVHWGLAMGSIFSFGSTEQREKWLPDMLCMKKIGSWALTEPYAGSDAAFGIQTTAVQSDDGWILNGEKKWSGNASMADVIVIWAVEPESKKMLGFLLEPNTSGLHIQKITDKIAKRAMENVLIRMNNIVVPESSRLPNVSSFKEISQQLVHGRVAVAWEALGIAMGALEAALAYTDQRTQFGKPIGAFQLIQEKLVTMVEEVTCMQALLMQLQRTEQQNGRISSAQASLAKRACCRRARQVCALAREVLGGNGILLEYGVARLFADMEAVYSYEGTDEINTLIVGRQLTGHSAFL